MILNLRQLFDDERGTSFLENVLWLIMFTLAIAIMIAGLADATGIKINQLIDRINQVGTP